MFEVVKHFLHSIISPVYPAVIIGHYEPLFLAMSYVYISCTSIYTHQLVHTCTSLLPMVYLVTQFVFTNPARITQWETPGVLRKEKSVRCLEAGWRILLDVCGNGWLENCQWWWHMLASLSSIWWISERHHYLNVDYEPLSFVNYRKWWWEVFGHDCPLIPCSGGKFLSVIGFVLGILANFGLSSMMTYGNGLWYMDNELAVSQCRCGHSRLWLCSKGCPYSMVNGQQLRAMIDEG